CAERAKHIVVRVLSAYLTRPHLRGPSFCSRGRRSCLCGMAGGAKLACSEGCSSASRRDRPRRAPCPWPGCPRSRETTRKIPSRMIRPENPSVLPSRPETLLSEPDSLESSSLQLLSQKRMGLSPQHSWLELRTEMSAYLLRTRFREPACHFLERALVVL